MAAVTGSIKGKTIGYKHSNVDNVQVRRVKVGFVYTPATADDSDTLSVDLGKAGIKDAGLWGIRGVTHTTDNSVLVIEAPTTAVSSGTLTITIGGSTDNKTRGFFLFGEE